MRRATIVFSCLMSVALAGCGGSAATPATPGSTGAAPTGAAGTTSTVAAMTVSAPTQAAVGPLPDACTVLTKSEIAGVVGNTVLDGAKSGTNCQWERTDVHKIAVAVHLLVLPGTLKCQIVGATPVDGFDVPAAWHYLSNLTTGSVTACPAGRQIQITVIGDSTTGTTPEDMLRTDAVALMHIALPRM